MRSVSPASSWSSPASLPAWTCCSRRSFPPCPTPWACSSPCLLGGGGLGSAPGITIFPEEFGIKLLTLPVGGFLTLGALIALMQWALAKSEKKKEAK